MEQLRLFFAIDLPEYIKNSLLKQAQQDNADIWRWTFKDNLHLTLEFIGYAKEEDLVKIIEIGEKIRQESQPFTLKINYLCFGPEKGTAKRMIWAVLEKSESLERLKTSLEENLLNVGVGFTFEERQFNPHITLARLKYHEPYLSSDYKKEFLAQFEVAEILLMHSELRQSGPKYSVIQKFPL